MASTGVREMTWEAIRDAGLALAAAAALTGCEQVDLGQVMREAAAAAGEGRWELALSRTALYLEEDESNVDALVLHGLALHKKGEVAKATTMFERAAILPPERFESQYFYGWVLCEQEEYGRALKPLEAAHALQPANPDVLALLGKCCLEQNVRRGATYVQGLQRHRAYGSGPEVPNALACLALGQDPPDVQKALRELQKARDRAPENPVVLQNLAVLCDHYLRDPEEAVRYYRYCLSASQRAGQESRADAVRRRLREISGERAVTDPPGG